MLDGSASVQTETQSTANRDARARSLANLKPIRPGQALNPRGRPKKDHDLAAMAQKHAELAVQTLAKCLVDPDANWPAKVSAASEILDRGFGRAPQSLNVDHKIGFSEQFEDFMRALLEKPRAKVIEAVPAAFEVLPPLVRASDGSEAEPQSQPAAE